MELYKHLLAHCNAFYDANAVRDAAASAIAAVDLMYEKLYPE